MVKRVRKFASTKVKDIGSRASDCPEREELLNATSVAFLVTSATMTVAEVAAALGVSVSTAEQDWRLARAWLASQLGGGDG
jgi:DNA-binding MurR/RpiR family transcriptional regulator